MVALAHDGTVNRSEPRDPDAAQLVSEQPKVARLLDDIVVSHRSLLGANLVGIYLHGSRATGDHGPHSDVDYLVVVERPLALAEKRQPLSALRELSKRAPAHGIEMSVITSEALRRFRHPAPFEFHFSGDWLQRYERRQVDLETPRTDPDLASHVTQTRERGRTLYGSPLESVFPRIDRKYYVEGTLNDAHAILSDPRKHPLYTVLNLCRALAVVRGTMTPSKLEAADWALANLPDDHHPLVREATRGYQMGGGGDGLDQGRLASFVSYMERSLARDEGESAGMRSQIATRLLRDGARAAFQVRVEDPVPGKCEAGPRDGLAAPSTGR